MCPTVLTAVCVQAQRLCRQRDGSNCEAGLCMSEITSRSPTPPATVSEESAAPSYLPPHLWTQSPRNGKIVVAPRAIATVAGRAVAECYGVVGIAARTSRFGRVELLAP